MPSVDKFLQILFSNQILLIGGLIALMLGICIIWLFASLQKESESGDKNYKDLEKVLEKVIQKTGGINAGSSGGTSGGASPSAPASTQLSAAGEALLKMKIGDKPPSGFPAPGAASGMPGAGGGLPGMGGGPKPMPTPLATTPTPGPTITGGGATPAPAPAAPSGPSPEQLAEMNKLKAENESKTQKLNELEKAVTQAKEELAKAKEQAQATGNTPKVNVDEFNKKIKELESRLAEYEIIEDDIANLSLYKDENARLKDELQKMKSSGIGAVAAVPEPVAPPPPKEEPVIALKQDAPAPPPPQAETPVAAAAAPEDSPLDSAIDATKLVAEVADLAAKPIEESSGGENKDSGDKLIEEFENFVKGGLDKS